MRKRDRLKHKLRQLMGRTRVQAEEPGPTPASSAPPPPDTRSVDEAQQPDSLAEVIPLEVSSGPVPAPQAEAVDDTDEDTHSSEDSGGGSASNDEDAAAEAEKARKAAKHFERTRIAMLKFIVDQGDEASLADMHELSERRYFIGHKRFSTLMEGLVEEDLIDFDHATGIASITGAGKEYLA